MIAAPLTGRKTDHYTGALAAVLAAGALGCGSDVPAIGALMNDGPGARSAPIKHWPPAKGVAGVG